MSFMQREIRHDLWLEVDGRNGVESIPAELVGHIGWMKVGSFYDCDGPFEEDSNLKLLLDNLEDYIEGSVDGVTQVQLSEGWGARLSAPGYMDCTEWAVFATREEAEAYLDEMYEDDLDSEGGEA